MRNIVDSSVFTSPITVLENGDPVDQSSTQNTIQALANRTAYLNGAASVIQGIVARSWVGNSGINSANNMKAIRSSKTLGLLIAVGSGAAGAPLIFTSPDGATWTSRTSPNANDFWVDIARASSLGLTVIVGQGTTFKVATSTDGITWVGRSGPTDALTSIAWSPTLGVFIASSTSTRLWQSTDGITWSSIALSNAYQQVLWAPSLGKFFAFRSGGLATSTDGAAWSEVTSAGGPAGGAITWADAMGIFATPTGAGPGAVRTSPDGTTWTTILVSNQNISLAHLSKPAFSDDLNMFVMVDTFVDYGTGGLIVVSTDGVSWVQRQVTAGVSGGNAITWSDYLQRFVSLADGTGQTNTVNMTI